MTGSNLKPDLVSRLSATVIREESAEVVRMLSQKAGISESTVSVLTGDDLRVPDQNASVVVVEIGSATPARLARVEDIVAHAHQGTTIIAILDSPSSEDVRRLFRAGVSDVLSFPINHEELSSALEAAKRNMVPVVPARNEGGKLISLLKTGGGVGATTVAINLARELAHKGAGRIALVDMDVQFGGVEVSLDIEPRLNFSDAVRAGQRLDGTMLKSMMTHHKSGFDVLPAAKSVAPIDVVSEDFVHRFCEQLKASYDVVLFDMPTCWAPWFFQALEASDLIMPVVEPTVRSADCARRIVQAIEDLGSGKPRFLPVANKTTREPATKDRLKAISEILHAKVDLQVREESKIAQQAADLGLCLRDVSASAGITQDFEQIAAAVVTLFALQAAEPAEPTGKARRISFFGARS